MNKQNKQLKIEVKIPTLADFLPCSKKEYEIAYRKYEKALKKAQIEIEKKVIDSMI